MISDGLSNPKYVSPKPQEPLPYSPIKSSPQTEVAAMANGVTNSQLITSMNPGAFILHCHIQPHLAGGMAMAMLDGVGKRPAIPAAYGPNDSGMGMQGREDLLRGSHASSDGLEALDFQCDAMQSFRSFERACVRGGIHSMRLVNSSFPCV
ncbi:hypothetical protein L228DRAFT_270254 [Xylona heveae TC161]|uniref:Plastocyanin-like domain-containing protein n=1 Tax=Xylona heveae (strain CBS 132557 / TC161) TaxID=1328760 RepID=A0A165AA65_XYLHT|nr:hypothetical protein L228DRAFT_270254 [Xylona heveae TC161]KZF20160.1 hypothetical protein L228DRAFT_270254 [Xylona heveae TC161]